MPEINLTTRLVGEIKGTFFVPDYQRGYRWGKNEVETLLNDVYEYGSKLRCHENENYCLQPIVVRNHGDKFELIDGQQRLTTIYLIYACMHEISNGFMSEPCFSLSYETRQESSEFLKKTDEKRKDDNIDFFFICSAYKTIKEWFFPDGKLQQHHLTRINDYFNSCVKVIWYEVPDSEDGVSLFTRLNIGKIPLTSSELVKALFLKIGNEGVIRQEELSLEWDAIERELHEEAFWGFLSNRTASDYQTRIDLVLDLMANKQPSDKEPYRTFLHFDKKLKDGETLTNIWNDIRHNYLTLKEWFADHDFYHKIGYLIASGSRTLQEMLNEYEGKSKSDFRAVIDGYIKQSVTFGKDKDYDELSYANATDKWNIQKLLLLFNVESVRLIDNKKMRFPFGRHKEENWSLEHIHAQNSEGLQTNGKIRDWLKAHVRSLKSIGGQEELVASMDNLITQIAENPKTAKVREQFEQLQADVIKALTPQDDDAGEYIHLLPNMALLSAGQNSALSNYTFDAKRNYILEMDKKGEYIPFCTKMVFMKYYSTSETNLHFWSKSDRDAYLKAIKNILSNYFE